MVMPISFLDYLDTRKVFKGYQPAKAADVPTSGTQTPNSKTTQSPEMSDSEARVENDSGQNASNSATVR